MGFSLSVQSNPALDGTKDMNMMIRLLDKLDILLKLGIRSTILELMKVAAKFDDPAIFQVSPSYEEVTMDLLAGGHNEGFAVLAKVLYLVNNEKIYPLYYVLCDTKLDCFILTVHGIHEMAGVVKGSNRKWYMDSGCSKYMTRSIDDFLSLKALQGGSVSFGNGKKGYILGVGVTTRLVVFKNPGTYYQNRDQ